MTRARTSGTRAGTTVDVALPARRNTGPTSPNEDRWHRAPHRLRGGAFAALRFAHPLPPVCVRHGQPEVERKTTVTNFHQEPAGRVQNTFLSTLPAKFNQRNGPVTNTELHVEWPVCADCKRTRSRSTTASALLALSGIVLLVAVFLANTDGAPAAVTTALLLLLVPGWLPCGIVAAGALAQHGQRYARIRPITAFHTIVVRAHPNFAEAVRATRD